MHPPCIADAAPEHAVSACRSFDPTTSCWVFTSAILGGGESSAVGPGISGGRGWGGEHALRAHGWCAADSTDRCTVNRNTDANAEGESRGCTTYYVPADASLAQRQMDGLRAQTSASVLRRREHLIHVDGNRVLAHHQRRDSMSTSYLVSGILHRCSLPLRWIDRLLDV
ncbi:hypothetical protein HYPSUDRAFT_413313 [Hypholoma sublateritium FD-334 SS-4]|uniref:Uncharacterized protein n=1 Tax=Hypholoma sublateritium (strain FD-334 SS-4) TaxID=945553 RepID=A0A0D2NE14_HYPSF|nr:hypothetical protein HYPSUDRAFT_413313 [Hypholoma sublateritium FD-334 SS-4]